jgi:hypothetical protein
VSAQPPGGRSAITTRGENANHLDRTLIGADHRGVGIGQDEDARAAHSDREVHDCFPAALTESISLVSSLSSAALLKVVTPSPVRCPK